MGNSLPEGFRIGVLQAADSWAHAHREYIVYSSDYFAAGAEIVAEQDLSFRPRGSGGNLVIPFVFFQEDSRIRQTKPVDGLFYVADQKAIPAFGSENGENGILDSVGVLVLIHQHLPVALSNLPGGGGGAGAALPHQQVQRPMLQISEVQNSSAALCMTVVIRKLPHQMDQPPNGRGHVCHIFQQLPGVSRKPALLFLQTLLAGIPYCLDPVRQLLVRIFPGKAQGTKVHIQAADRIIPAFALTKIRKLQDGGGKILRHFFKFRNLVRLFQAFGKGLDMSIQKELQIRKKVLSPGGPGYVRSCSRLGGRNALIQPHFRIQVTAGTVKDLEDKFRKAPIIPPKALGIRKGPEVRVLSQFFVSPVQGVRENGSAKLPGFCFVCHPKIRGNIQAIGVLPQDLGAKTVDRGDLGQIQPLELLLQVTVLRLRRDPGGQLRSDFAPQFRRGSLCISNDQEIIQLGRRGHVR